MEQDPPISIREKVAYELAEAAYAEVDRKYGENGVEPRSYHNEQHGIDVVTDGLAIADKAIEAGKLKPKDRALVIIAGAYHDMERSLEDGVNETSSAFLAAKGMRESGQFTEQDIERVSLAIQATMVFFDEGGIMRQSAGEDYLTKVLADADVANLGYETEMFWQKSLALFNENHPDHVGMDKFRAFQKELLTYHAFYTPEAAILFPNQADNLAFTERNLENNIAENS